MARLTKFSDAMSSRPDDWRFTSSRIAFAMSGSVSSSARQCAAIRFDIALSLLRRGDLIDAFLVTSAFERGLQPQRQNFVGEPEGDDPPAHREDVGVVVFARQARRIEIVAESGPYARDFIGCDL